MPKRNFSNPFRKISRKFTKAWPFGNVSLLITILVVVALGGFLVYKIFAKSYPVNNWSYWAPRIRACESGGTVYGRVNWTAYNSTRTSSGHASGGYQITSGTWQAFGGRTYASEARYASSSQQHNIASKIFNHYGGGSTGSWRASYHCWKPGGSIRSAPALPSCALNDQVCSSSSGNPGSGSSSSSVNSCSYVGPGDRPERNPYSGGSHVSWKPGVSGTCIKHLQWYLTRFYHFTNDRAKRGTGRAESGYNPGGIHGRYDEGTRRAVAYFQGKFGLSGGGTMNSSTWSKIHSVCASLRRNWSGGDGSRYCYYR